MFGEMINRSHPKNLPLYDEKPWDPFFYQHVQDIVRDKLLKGEKYVEFMNTLPYLFRYDRGAFWCAKTIHEMFVPMLQKMGYGYFWWLVPSGVENSSIKRFIMNKMLSTANMFKIAMKIPDSVRESTALLQDVDVPMTPETLEKLFTFLFTDLKLFPLWLCPVRNHPQKEKNFQRFKQNANGTECWCLRNSGDEKF